MAGLSLNLGAGAQVRSGAAGTGNGGPPPATAGQAAFGPGYTSAGVPDARSSLFPNDPFGVALWVGIGAVGLLALIRYSLPA